MRTATGLLAMVIAALAPVAVLAAPPGDAHVERDTSGTLTVSWTSPDPVDVLVTDRPDSNARQAELASARDGDGRFTTAVPEASRRYFLLRNARTGEIARTAERLVPLEAGFNFRDIGGYPAASGRHVRWGMIYRSGGSPLLSDSDRQRIGGLHLANMVDLRSDEERVLAPTRIDGVPYTAVGYSMAALNVGGGMEATYKGLPATMAPQLRQIFARLLRGEQPLVYNCSAGQDRTGFVTSVILSALGTPHDVIIADYHLSTRYRRPEFEMPHLDPAAHPGNPAVAMFAQFQDNPQARKPRPLMTADGKPFLDFAFAEIDAKWGSIDSYLQKELGIGPHEIARLRADYTR